MKTFLPGLLMLVFAASTLSCHEDIETPAGPELLVVGKWNSYEVGSTTNGFTPGRETLLTIVYAGGIIFSADHSFAMRFYDGAWHDAAVLGTYAFLTDKTIELTFSPGTRDELKLELKINKLDNEVLWFSHDFWVNDQNHDPTENHLQRAE